MSTGAREVTEVDEAPALSKLHWELVRTATQELDQILQGLDPMTEIHPTHDRVLVMLIPEEYVSASGLVLTVTEKAPWRGMVLGVGPTVNEHVSKRTGPTLRACDYALIHGDGELYPDECHCHQVCDNCKANKQLETDLVYISPLPSVLQRGSIVVVDGVSGHRIPCGEADQAKLDLRLLRVADIIAILDERGEDCEVPPTDSL